MGSQTRQPTCDLLIKQIARAISGWVTFQQSANRSPVYGEVMTYLPIFEVAAGQKWDIVPQFQLRSRELRQNPKTVDFFFSSKTGKEVRIAILEIKFIKPRAAFTQSLTADVIKMNSITQEMILFCTGLSPNVVEKYLMVIGPNDNIMKAFRRPSENQILRDQATSIWGSAIDPRPERKIPGSDVPCLGDINTPEGFLRVGDATFSSSFKVMSLKSQNNWPLITE